MKMFLRYCCSHFHKEDLWVKMVTICHSFFFLKFLKWPVLPTLVFRKIKNWYPHKISILNKNSWIRGFVIFRRNRILAKNHILKSCFEIMLLRTNHIFKMWFQIWFLAKNTILSKSWSELLWSRFILFFHTMLL